MDTAKATLLTLFLVTVFALPFVVFAQGATAPPAVDGNQPGATAPQGGLVNPLRFTTLQDFLVAVLDAIILILFPFLVLAIVYAGFKFVTAQGKAEALSEARRALLWVLIGSLIILGAKALSIGIAATVRDITTYVPTDHTTRIVVDTHTSVLIGSEQTKPFLLERSPNV